LYIANKTPNISNNTFITSGIINNSKSIKLKVNKQYPKMAQKTLCKAKPNFRKTHKAISPPNNSTIGYFIGIFDLQLRHLPFKKM
jgi:hypothetical protein